MNKTELTAEERAVISHAIGSREKTSYRNFYYATVDDPRRPIFDAMVKRGLLTCKRDILNEVNDSLVYTVTEKGKQAL